MNTRDRINYKVSLVFQPSMRNRVQQASFKAVRKELVFDIDMTDYDDTRTCCSEANICPKCWKFMIIAMKVLDRALRSERNTISRTDTHRSIRHAIYWLCLSYLQRILGSTTCCGCTAVVVASTAGCVTSRPSSCRRRLAVPSSTTSHLLRAESSRHGKSNWGKSYIRLLGERLQTAASPSVHTIFACLHIHYITL